MTHLEDVHGGKLEAGFVVPIGVLGVRGHRCEDARRTDAKSWDGAKAASQLQRSGCFCLAHPVCRTLCHNYVASQGSAK